MIKIVFTDIDGTLFSHGTSSIPDSAWNTLRQLQKEGIQVWGCTGRHPEEIKVLLPSDLKLDGWITVNGALCTQGERTIYSAFIPHSEIETLIEEIEKDPFPVQMQERDRIWCNMINQDLIDGLAEIHTKPDPIEDLHRALDHEIVMFIPWCSDKRWNPVFEKLHGLKQVRWNNVASDVFSIKAGKDAGITAVLSHLGIAKEEALALGDADNDLAMFKACAHSVAMGNATPAVKKAAEYIAADIDEDGWAEGIRHFIEL